MTDLILAIVHHLTVLTLVAILGAELVLLRGTVSGQRLRQLGAVDAAYGAIAGIVLVVGVVRVFFGASGWEYYVGNGFFWMKMAAFLVVGLLSIPPTIAIVRWRKAEKIETNYAAPAASIATAQRFLYAEALVLVLIPAFAAAMARGF